MTDYRVNLDVYNGPLDLLLYLIRRDEVDIYDIPIARITEQYVAYVEMIRKLDPNLAGEFLVLAATLIEIKTRMLLPTPPPEEAGQEGVTIDPRAELVRQLLEYKAFKDAAGELREAAEAQALRFPRCPPREAGETETVDLEDAQIWDLFDAFGRMMEAIGQSLKQHEVIYDDTPVELHATDILDRLEREGSMTFRQVFAGRTIRTEIVGLFLALLELMRQRKILAIQDANFGEIQIHLNPNPPAAASEPDESPAESAPAESSAADGDRPATDGGPQGAYVAEPKDLPEKDDEPGEETAGTWS